MKRAFLVAAVCLVAGCHTHVKIDDTFPGRTAREILAHAQSATITRTKQPSGVSTTRKLGARDRERVIEALLALEPSSGCRCLCGFLNHKWYVDYQVKSPQGTVTLEKVYGCPFVPSLKVVPAKTGKTTLLKVSGPGVKAAEKIFKRTYPKSGPFPAGGWGAR